MHWAAVIFTSIILPNYWTPVFSTLLSIWTRRKVRVGMSFRILAGDESVLNKVMPGWDEMDALSGKEKKMLMYNSGAIHALYNPDSRIFSMIDTVAGQGWYYLPRAEDIPFYEKAAPMRMLLHWCCETAGQALVHAAAVGWAGRAVLLAGRGGAGKSTTAFLAAKSGFGFLGDDYVVLENRDRPRVLSLYNSLKFRWEMLDRLPSAGRCSRNDPSQDDKGYFYLHETHPDCLACAMPLQVVVLPLIAQQKKTTFTRIPASRGLMGLAASSIFQMPGSGDATLKKIAAILKDTPVYQMSLGNDNEEIISALKSFLNSNRQGEEDEPSASQRHYSGL